MFAVKSIYKIYFIKYSLIYQAKHFFHKTHSITKTNLILSLNIKYNNVKS